ncbi:MAG: hypothetical protein GY862_29875, partial [Gammaproteobacteria bacterium]|nr:hypothetical protein [Gammaproteobacteria bacterium]
REKETASIDVIRENGDSGEVCITYTARAGTENSILHEGDVCWADGISGSQTIEIPINAGEDAEYDKIVLLALSGATGCAESGSPGEAILLISGGSNGPGILRFAEPAYTINENAGEMSIVVVRSDGHEGEVSVEYNTFDESANAKKDYVSQRDTLTWEDGVSGGQSFHITILDDDIREGSETLFLNLSNPANGAKLELPSMVELNIVESLPDLGNGFAGGIALGDREYQPEVTKQLLADETMEGKITAEIKMADRHLGKQGDIFIGVHYRFAGIDLSFLKGPDGMFSEWDGNLAAAMEEEALQETYLLDIYEGLLPPGLLDVYFGYRAREDDTLVFNGNHPIRIDISEAEGGESRH